MAFKLNSVFCVWRTASLGHLNLNRGRQLGNLLLGNGGGSGCGGGVNQLISFSSTCNQSSWSLLSRGITTINSSCNYCLTNFGGDQKKPHDHPLLSSAAPCLLIPSPKNKDDDHELFAAGITKEVSKGTGEENEGSNFPDYCLYSLAERKVVSLNNVRSKSYIVMPNHANCIGSSHGWLFCTDLRRDDYVLGDNYGLFLTNPLITPVRPTIQIPSLSCIPKKLVMSSPPSGSGYDDSTVLMAIDFQNSFAYYKFGDSSWRGIVRYELEDGINRPWPDEKYCPEDYNDIVYCTKDQLFYLIDCTGQIEAWDLGGPYYKLRGHGPPCRLRIGFGECSIQKPDFPEYEQKMRRRESPGKYYLVMDPFSGDFLIVRRYAEPIAEDGSIVVDWENSKDHFYCKTVRFEVYRFSAAKKSWDYVECLGDGVVFVGDNQSFIVSAKEFPPGVLRPNSIYFTDDHEECRKNKKKADMGIYNLRDFTVAPIFPSHHPFNNNPPRPFMWFNPNPC